jgi:hypothetical protein
MLVPGRAARAGDACVLAPCPVPQTQSTTTSKRSALITRANGGALIDTATHARFDFPPGAAPRDIVVSYESGITPPAPTRPGRSLLGTFRLSATDAQGRGYRLFDAPWVATIDYGECADDAGICVLDVVNEASLHCATLDEATDSWHAVESRVDVLANRLTCTAARAAVFAVAATPADTSGETDYRTHFLPLVGG